MHRVAIGSIRMPGVRFNIEAYPPDGLPYLIRKTSDLRHKDGALVKNVDVILPRGALVRGRVVDSKTKAPISDATIQYVPREGTLRKAPEGIVTGFQGIQPSDETGALQLPVFCQGQGTLLVHGPHGQFVLREIGSRELDRGLPGGERTYAHAIQSVDPQSNAEPLDLTIELDRGATVSGEIRNAAGEPVESARVVTRLSIRQGSLNWRGFSLEAMGGRFELSGLAEGVEYPVHFLDPKNRLGATVMLKAGMKSPIVVLEPCTAAVGTFVDGAGKPVQGQPLQFVATPGPQRFARMAEALGALTADTDFYSNIDRADPGPQLDAEGRTTYTGLISGARYRILDYVKGEAIVVAEFVAESGKTLDLGKITMSTRNDE